MTEQDRVIINDLLYIQKQVVEIINVDVGEILRGRGRTPQKIKESLDYQLEERFNLMIRKYTDEITIEKIKKIREEEKNKHKIESYFDC